MQWPTVELERAAEIRGGATPPRDRLEYWGGEIPWVTPTDLPELGSGITEVVDTANTITTDGLNACSASVLPAGTVLFSSRATIGKVAIAAVPLATNQGFANLIPHPGVDSRYLAWCLLFHAERISTLAGSTTFKEVAKGALKQFRIPLPPLSEQRRIVEILDQADRLRRLRAEADAKADRILPALFIKMFGDPVDLTTHVAAKPLSAFDVDLQNGFACGEKDVGSGVPHLRMNNISDSGRLDLSLLRTVPIGRDSKRYRLQVGDVLFMSTNSEEKVGKACLFDLSAPDPVLFSNHLIRIRIRCAELVPEYVATYLHLLWRAGFYPAIAKRWVNQATVSREALGRVPIVPFSKETQLRFAAAYRALALEIDHCRASRRALDRLFTSLVHRAFDGRLTASWREAHMKELLQEMERQAKALSAATP